jgi:hypothetical protein
VLLLCDIALYPAIVKQRLKCNTGKVFNCLNQFLLSMVPSILERLFLVEYVFRDVNRYNDLVQEQFAEKFPETPVPHRSGGAEKSAVYRDRPLTLNELRTTRTVYIRNISQAVLYVQVAVHRDNLRINNQQDAPSIQNFILSRNSTCCGHLLCPSSGVISRTRGNWYVSCKLCGRCLGESASNRLYMLRASSVPIIKSYQLYTWQLVYFVQVMWPLPRRVRLFQPHSPSGHITCMKHTNCHVYS